MSWKIELYRAFFVAFGAMETICNSKYLLDVNGLEKARKQHGELPHNLADRNIKTKVICMMISGIVFLCVGLASFFLHRPMTMEMGICLTLFACYAVIEASYYRYRNTYGFAAISIFVLVLYFFIKN